jgi:signal transduction histidine kinase
MRLRSRLAVALVAAHLLLIAVVASLAWRWVDVALKAQAEDSARSVGRVLARGGFSTDERVLERMRELSGHDFRLLDRPAEAREGYVVVSQGPVSVEVDYRTERYAAARRTLLVTTAAVALFGSLAFAVVAWWLALRFARPIEDLSTAARALGGNLDRMVPQVGVGEIAGLARELETMRTRLVAAAAAARQAERLATLGTFAATVAHEVRNPLTAVALHVQMLRQESPGDPDLQRIAEELERLDLVVDEVLSFARGMRCEPADCDLQAVAGDVVRLLRRQAEHAGVGLEVDGQGRVRADPQRIRQCLLNLVLNAVQACSSGRGSRVRVVVASGSVTVEDDGPGVPAEFEPRLFAPFATGRDQGTGLGLHLAKAVADAHGALLTYSRGDGQSRFTVRFPA